MYKDFSFNNWKNKGFPQLKWESLQKPGLGEQQR